MVEAVRDGRIGDWHDPIYSNQMQMQEYGLQVLKFPAARPSDIDMPATSEFLRRAA